MNKQKHKPYMAQILGLILRDKELCSLLAFKGFFHRLARFSTDLDFNLGAPTKIRGTDFQLEVMDCGTKITYANII